MANLLTGETFSLNESVSYSALLMPASAPSGVSLLGFMRDVLLVCCV
jgi:hypothetical protein